MTKQQIKSQMIWFLIRKIILMRLNSVVTSSKFRQIYYRLKFSCWDLILHNIIIVAIKLALD